MRTCCYPGCENRTPYNDMLMCRPHWQLIPDSDRADLWKAHNRFKSLLAKAIASVKQELG